MRRTVWGMLAALLLVATACSVTTKDPSYVPPPPLPPLEQLEKAPLVDPKDFSTGGGDVLSFITEDHSVACSLTSARGEHLNLPYEQNRYSDTANNKLPTVPVAHCELARYPAPQPADVKDDCAGTNLGYLGGVALLAPDNARYGQCRSGVTSMEAAFGPRGSKSGPLAELHVLADGQNIERNGLRCSAYNGGVACGNVSAGVGFFVSTERYELAHGPGKDASKMPSEAPKTP